MFQGIVFDLDGTLLNTLPTIAYYGNQSLKAHGFGTIPEDAYRYMVGEGAVRLVSRMLAYTGGTDEDFEAVYADYMQAYVKDTTYLTCVYDDIPELLKALQNQDFSMAVFSNKPQEQLDGVIRGFFPKVPFTAVIGSSPSVPAKPDPEGVFRILRSWHMAPQNCLYVGDTATDMLTGRHAGLKTIGALWGFRDRDELEKSGADLIAQHPMEILEGLEA